MDDGTTTLAASIGAKVRLERLNRGWTLDGLAEIAGVSRRVVVNVEQGATNPSIGTLLKLSDALGVGLPALVEAPASKPVRVTRDGDGALLWQGPSGGRGVLVAGTDPPDVVELWDWTLQPGEEHSSDAHVAGTRELLQVLDGIVALDVEESSVTLQVGDAVSFSSNVPHAYRNPGQTPACFSLAVFEPGVGSHLKRTEPADD